MPLTHQQRIHWDDAAIRRAALRIHREEPDCSPVPDPRSLSAEDVDEFQEKGPSLAIVWILFAACLAAAAVVGTALGYLIRGCV